MKPYILFISLFNDNWDQFRSNIYSLIEDNLDFSCNINYIIIPDDIFFYNNSIYVEWNATDGEDNGGSVTAFFDSKGLVKVSLYFQYEDGNEYNNVLWKRI